MHLDRGHHSTGFCASDLGATVHAAEQSKAPAARDRDINLTAIHE